MTFMHVMTPQGRLTGEQRRVLAKTLTDAVLVPEVGRLVPQARRGYQDAVPIPTGANLLFRANLSDLSRAAASRLLRGGRSGRVLSACVACTHARKDVTS